MAIKVKNQEKDGLKTLTQNNINKMGAGIFIAIHVHDHDRRSMFHQNLHSTNIKHINKPFFVRLWLLSRPINATTGEKESRSGYASVFLMLVECVVIALFFVVATSFTLPPPKEHSKRFLT